MIPVRGYDGHKVAVLGLGRSGRPAISALRAGGAEVVAWDDGEAARATAEAEGIALVDLTRPKAFDGVAALIVSPGIPHLYPAPHAAVAAAWEAGVAVDNDVGLFFRSFATPAWESGRRRSSASPARTASRRRRRCWRTSSRPAGGRCRWAATSAAACSTSTRPRTAWW
jgi:hypothetical protein